MGARWNHKRTLSSIVRGRRRRGAAGALTGLLVAATLVAGMFTVVAAPASAANSRSRPVLFVHGYDPNFFGSNATPRSDCRSNFGDMTWQMRNEGWSGELVYVGFYAADSNCDVNLHQYAYYDDRSSWKDIAKAMSWLIYNNYTSRGVQVDLVGYSMGGLITRGAIHGARLREAGFSPPLDVAGSVSLGAPFGGASIAGLCLWGQCGSMNALSPDLSWLNTNCYPQGRAGTLWTVFASTSDWTARPESAGKLCTWPDRKYVLDNVVHGGVGSYAQPPPEPGYVHPYWWVTNLVMNSLDGQTSRIYSGANRAKCLDIRLMSTAAGTPVQSYDCNNTYAQLWTRALTGWPTQIQALGGCLDRAANSLAPGTRVQLWPCNGSPAQQWIQSSDGTIRSYGMCLDAPGGNTANSTQLIIWYCNGGLGQRWA